MKKNIIKFTAIACISLISISISGCYTSFGSYESAGYIDFVDYMNNTGKNNDSSDGRFKVKSEDYQGNTNTFSIMRMGLSVNDKFLYLSHGLKLDFKTGKIKPFCSIPGCAHGRNSHGCMNHRDIMNPIGCSEGIYFTSGNKLLWSDGASEKTLFENKSFTSFNNNFNPDSKYVITASLVLGDIIYLTGADYFFTYNIKTGEHTEPVELCKGVIYGMATLDGNLYYVNDSDELFYYNKYTGAIKKVGDKVYGVFSAGDLIYYTQSGEGNPTLYSANYDFTEVKPVVTDCYVNAYVDDTGIYYQKNHLSDDSNFYHCGLDGSDPQIIEAPLEENEIKQSIRAKIVSGDYIDTVFFVIERSFVIAMNKNTGKCIRISLDEYIDDSNY
ncbi:MAG TPA: hypothetical protein DDX91_04155 [Ruminococcaceae bacterium]|nr:hypothetical protein [Oscillospiraceae bacterium]